MLRRHTLWLASFSGVAAVCVLALRGPTAAQGPNFDKLNDTDRKVLSERFTKEVWPLLNQGGKDGCIGCHNGKIVSALRFTGDPDKDFRKLLRDGFFLKDDPGSLLSRIEDRNAKRRMPPPKNGSPWPEADKKVLEAFVDAIEKKQR